VGLVKSFFLRLRAFLSYCSPCGVRPLCLGHVAHTACRAADRHARLQVVDAVADGCDEQEEDDDDEEDDDVALHGCGGAKRLAKRSDLMWWAVKCGLDCEVAGDMLVS
jgi:hypothetical protein